MSAARRRKPIRQLDTKTAGGLIRRTTYLPPEMAEQLRRLSERCYRPESDLIRDALREYLEQHT